jgi:hypothetical protein
LLSQKRDLSRQKITHREVANTANATAALMTAGIILLLVIISTPNQCFKLQKRRRFSTVRAGHEINVAANLVNRPFHFQKCCQAFFGAHDKC